MTLYCAPDLPFWGTVAWYTKQIGSVCVIMLGTTAVLVLVAVTLDKLGVIKL